MKDPCFGTNYKQVQHYCHMHYVVKQSWHTQYTQTLWDWWDTRAGCIETMSRHTHDTTHPRHTHQHTHDIWGWPDTQASCNIATTHTRHTHDTTHSRHTRQHTHDIWGWSDTQAGCNIVTTHTRHYALMTHTSAYSWHLRLTRHTSRLYSNDVTLSRHTRHTHDTTLPHDTGNILLVTVHILTFVTHFSRFPQIQRCAAVFCNISTITHLILSL